MGTVKGIVATFLVLAMLIAGVGQASAAGMSNNLGDLFVLGSLFGNGNDSSGVLNSNNNGDVDLGNLFVLDQLFAGNGTTKTSVSRTTSNGNTSLGELIILNQLFNRNNLFNGAAANGDNNLGRLFVLDRLFSSNGNGIFSSSGLLGGTTATTRSTATVSRPATINAPSSTINAPNSTVNTGATTTP